MSLYTDEYGEVRPVPLVLTIAAVVITAVVLFASWPLTIIGETQRGIVLRNGAYDRTLEPGLHFRMPIFENVIKAELSVQTLQTSIPVYSKDSQVVDTHVTVNYRLNPALVKEAYRDSQLNYEAKVIAPNMPDVLESALSDLTAQELIDQRSTLGGKVKSAVLEKFVDRPYIAVDTVSVELDFDDDYEAAVKRKQVAEQEALTQANITEQEEQKKQQEIKKAEALSEKTRLEAQALASQQGQKVIEKIYAEAYLEMAKKWQGGVPQTVVNSGDGSDGGGFFSFLQMTKNVQ